MEAKHTPGPWHVGGFEQSTIYDCFGQRVANSFEGVMVVKRSDAECRANARLIAATPELLEALRRALNALEEIGKEMTVGERYTNAGQYLLDALNPAREAIAKATP